MTVLSQSQFVALSDAQQEEFINSGGTILPIDNKEVACDKPLLDSSTHQVNCQLANTLPSQQSSHSAVDVGVQEGSSETNAPSESDELKESLASAIADSPPAIFSQKGGFDIKDPVELLFLLDDSIASGETKLHPWQVRFMLDFADSRHTKDHPFQACVRAANGSGKDKYIVAACAVWLGMAEKSSRGVGTNGSGVQLDNQTEYHIDALCKAANTKFCGGKEGIWKCNYRYYECLLTRSPIVLFATDEPNKAEGYHPLASNCKMAIFASEAKAIPDEIFEALGRCSGFTHKVYVSSPGSSMGHFFETDSTAIPREELKDIKSVKPTDWIKYLVTAYDCPHISKTEIEIFASNLPGGKNSPVFKSGILAEFGSSDEMVVVQYRYVYKCTKNEHWEQEEHNKAGLDLSDGGDETVLAIRNGNKITKIIAFRFDNSEDTINYLDEQFRSNDLNNPDSYIYADAGGIGKPMLDRLKAKGWSNIRYRDNRAKTTRPKVYKNWNAQAWFNFGRLCEQCKIILPTDKKLLQQASTRPYKIIDGQIHQMISKIEMRSRGMPSPDRADACVLAFSDMECDYPLPTKEDKPYEVKEVPEKPVSAFSLKSWAGEKHTRKDINGRYNVNNGQKNFVYLQDEVNEYNRKVELIKN